MTRNIQIDQLARANGYVPRNENFMWFSASNGFSTADYYYYVTYEETGVRVSVDVVDDDIATFASHGDSDNIEFIIQKNAMDEKYSVGNSLRVLSALGTDKTVVKRATGKTTLGSDEYDALQQNGKISVLRTTRTKFLDGYNGVTCDVWLAYSNWSINKAAALGNMTIDAAARNSHAVDGAYSASASAFRYYVGTGNYWTMTSRATRILADGKPTANFFDVPTLSECFEKSALYDGRKLMENLALVTGNGKVERFGKNAFMFSDRTYYVDPITMPADLEGLAYLYKGLATTTEFTITEAGYVIIGVPSIGFDSMLASLSEQGFTLITDKLPNMGKNATVTTEPTYYYVKWCAAGESYSVGKWNVVLFRSDGNFDAKNWMETAAKVNILSTDELKTKYDPASRLWQGIPGIETVTAGGKTRLWASWFTGKDKEPRAGNFAVYAFSDDNGATWTEAITVDFDSSVTDSRVFDPSLFNDGDGNLWLMWNQTNYNDEEISIWYAKITNPTAAPSELNIEAPVNIGHGLKMNKPTRLKSGELLFTAHDFNDIGNTKVYSSLDNGKTWSFKGKAIVHNATFANETALAEGKDENGNDALIMWNRCANNFNVAVSYSFDFGATWTDAVEWKLSGPSSRINARTLKSGNVLYVHHYNTTAREKLCVSLSVDGGRTFPHRLILDTRSGVSYPDIAVGEDGRIFIAWDRDRSGAKEILFTELSETQLLAAGDGDIMDSAKISTVSAP
ncbi:MAG: exo-alpha-sialidase [Candidatus Neoclostridium sp.]